MPQPQIDGYELLGLVGEGACGSVYIARKATNAQPGEWFAIRVFNALAVNRPLIENIAGRLTNGSYPKGVVPIRWDRSQHCLLYTSPSPRDQRGSRMPSSA